MAYERKPGEFALFKNDRKEKETHQDYKGDGLDLSGQEVWVSAWLKKGQKGTFMSCVMRPKEARPETGAERHARKAGTQPAPSNDGFDEESIPF